MLDTPDTMENETAKRTPKPRKIKIVGDLTDKVGRARGIYFTEYKGLTVAELTELRRLCRQSNVDYLVCKNTFSRRVLSEKGYPDALQHLDGPTALAFGYKDPAVPAKVLSDFAAKNEKLILKGGVFEGKLVTVKEIQVIKNLPSREVALAMLLGVLNAPVQGVYNVVAGMLRDVVSVIDQIIEQKKAAA
jgi:large subunit ribosomal protein L10